MENEGYVTVGTGNYGLIEADAAFNMVLGDTVAVRLAGTYTVEYAGFTLMPVGFFDRNPALDVPPSKHCGR